MAHAETAHNQQDVSPQSRRINGHFDKRKRCRQDLDVPHKHHDRYCGETHVASTDLKTKLMQQRPGRLKLTPIRTSESSPCANIGHSRPIQSQLPGHQLHHVKADRLRNEQTDTAFTGSKNVRVRLARYEHDDGDAGNVTGSTRI